MLQSSLDECLQWYCSLAHGIIAHQTQKGFAEHHLASSLDEQQRERQQRRREELQKVKDALQTGAALAKQRDCGKRSYEEMDGAEQKMLEEYETGAAKKAMQDATMMKLEPFRCELPFNKVGEQCKVEQGASCSSIKLESAMQAATSTATEPSAKRRKRVLLQALLQNTKRRKASTATECKPAAKRRKKSTATEHATSSSQPDTAASTKVQLLPRRKSKMEEVEAAKAAAKVMVAKAEIENQIDVRETAPWSDLNLAHLYHWKDCFLNSNAMKSKWTEATQHIDSKKWTNLEMLKPNIGSCERAWLGISGNIPMLHQEVDDFLPTPGKWFYSPLTLGNHAAKRRKTSTATEHATSSSQPDTAASTKVEAAKDFVDPRVAYHGTALTSSKSILVDGLKIGPSSTQKKHGVFCESDARKACAFRYSPHQMTDVTQGLCTGVVFELMVDRDKGDTARKQWTQPLGSFIITGVYTHQVPVALLYRKGFLGWYQIHPSVYTLCKSL